MDLKKYFETARGHGYLATADGEGKVDIAVYSRPHVEGDGTLAFGMGSRLTHANLQSNAHAVYAFDEGDWRGVRVFLRKLREEESGPLLEEIQASADRIVGPGVGGGIRHLVHFEVTKILPLVGT
jgi:hypothetical protein